MQRTREAGGYAHKHEVELPKVWQLLESRKSRRCPCRSNRHFVASTWNCAARPDSLVNVGKEPSGVTSDGSEDLKKGNRDGQTQTRDGWKVYEDVHLPSAQTHVFVSSKWMILWIGPNAVGSNLGGT